SLCFEVFNKLDRLKYPCFPQETNLIKIKVNLQLVMVDMKLSQLDKLRTIIQNGSPAGIRESLPSFQSLEGALELAQNRGNHVSSAIVSFSVSSLGVSRIRLHQRMGMKRVSSKNFFIEESLRTSRLGDGLRNR
ncbi:hypothetical protein KI387_034420, partial [Taxus chinensis]